MFEKYSFVSEYSYYYLSGMATTVALSLCTIVLGFILGTLLALMKLAQPPKQGLKKILIYILNKLSGAYIEIIRGTPLLVQAMIVYLAFNSISVFVASVVAMSLNSAAYVAEVIRAGILAVDQGQVEAAKSLGMPATMRFKEVIMPQAIKNILPALGNEFIVLIKESAVVSVIGAHDLMYNAGIVRSQTYLGLEPLFVAAGIYFVLTFSLSRLVKHFEGRLSVGK